MSDASSKTIRWNPVWGVLLIIALYFAAPLAASVILSGAAALTGSQLTQSTTVQFLYIVLVELMTVAAVIYFLRRRGASLQTLGFKKFRLKDIAIGVGLYPLYFIGFAAIIIIATALIPSLNVDQEQQLGFDNVTGALPLILTFISLVVLPPLVEELTVRGMIFTSLRSKLSLLSATLLTSFIFAIAHLPEGGSAGPLYIAAIDTFVLSLVLCVVREKTGSLWPCVVLHALKNGIAYASLFIFPMLTIF